MTEQPHTIDTPAATRMGYYFPPANDEAAKRNRDFWARYLQDEMNAATEFDCVWGEYQIMLPSARTLPIGLLASSYTQKSKSNVGWERSCHPHPIDALWTPITEGVCALLNEADIPWNEMTITRWYQPTGAPNEAENAPVFVSVGIDGEAVGFVPDCKDLIRRCTDLFESHHLENVFIEIQVAHYWGGMSDTRRLNEKKTKIYPRPQPKPEGKPID